MSPRCVEAGANVLVAGSAVFNKPDRAAAIQKMITALDEMVVLGVETNLDFQYQIMKNPVFRAGEANTGFIESIMKV